jgi:transcriptional regulator with XRE-family HTH domain
MDQIVGVGKRVRELRHKAQVTQRDIAERSGLTVSYLSRLENDRITPSVRTLRKIAEALEVPVSALFDGDHEHRPGESCPVSLSGQCILEHRYISRLTPPPEEETYNSEQLAILQQCNDLLQHGEPEVLMALDRVVRSLILLQRARENGPRQEPLRAAASDSANA